MSMNPGMFEHPEDFQHEEVQEAEEQHQHGEGCGHEAIEHDGHIDYVVGKRRHWWNRDHWDSH